MIRGGNIPIPRYMASFRELLSLIRSVLYIVPIRRYKSIHTHGRTRVSFFLSLFLFPFILFLLFFFLIRSRFDQCERQINQVDLLTYIRERKIRSIIGA